MWASIKPRPTATTAPIVTVLPAVVLTKIRITNAIAALPLWVNMKRFPVRIPVVIAVKPQLPVQIQPLGITNAIFAPRKWVSIKRQPASILVAIAVIL